MNILRTLVTSRWIARSLLAALCAIPIFSAVCLIGGIQEVGAVLTPTGSTYCGAATSGGFALGPSVNNVYACGPLPLDNGDAGPYIPTFWPVKGGSNGGF